MLRLLALFVLFLAGCSSSGSTAVTAPSSGPPGPPLGPPANTRAIASKSADSTIASTVNNVTVALVPGWNPLAFQCQQVTSLSNTGTVTGMAVFNGTGYTTQNFSQSNVNGFRGQAFWVFANSAGSFTYSGNDAGSPGVTDLNLNGYQLVSFCTSTPIPGSSLTATQNGQPVGLGTVVLPQFTEIGPNNQYTTVDVQAGGVIQPGRAYWIFANTTNGAVRLHVGPPGPAPSPSPSPAASPTAPPPSPSPNASPTPFVFASPVPAPSLAAHTTGLYTSFAQSYNVPYDNNVGFGSNQPLQMPTLTVQAFGQTFHPQMDTGSRGLRITQNLLPQNVVANLTGFEGYIFYWSSGRAFKGLWTTTNVIFPDAQAQGGAALPARATLPVLVQTQELCYAGDWPNSCGTPSVTNTTGPNDPKDTFMGVGFDRTGDGDVPEDNSHNQDYNPLLNLDGMRAGTMNAGYILTPQGVRLGLTDANTGPSGSFFSLAQLVPTGLAQVPQSPPDWQTALGFTATNATPPGGTTAKRKLDLYALGEAVVDTGIGNLLLTLPNWNTRGNVTVGDIFVNLFGFPNNMVGYTYRADETSVQGNRLAPTSTTLSPRQAGRFSQTTSTNTFVNTGRQALNGFNYLYDALNGYVGLQLNTVTPQSQAFNFPAIYANGVLKPPANFTTDLPVYVGANATITTNSTATYNAPVTVKGGTLTLTGGGTFNFNRGAFGNVTVVAPTRIGTNNTVTANVIAVPTVNFIGNMATPSPIEHSKPGLYMSVGDGPTALALIDTGSNALVVEQGVLGSNSVTTANVATIKYDHCTNPRNGTVFRANFKIHNGANGAAVLQSVANMPVVVVPDGFIGTNNRIIMGMRMEGANVPPNAGDALPSAKLFLPQPYNQAFVIDKIGNRIYFGNFPETDFGCVQLPSLNCNQPLPSPAQPLPCWDDSAIPVNYFIKGSPTGPVSIPSLFDTGAFTTMQFQSVPKADFLNLSAGNVLSNPITGVLQTTQGAMYINLDDEPVVVGPTNCNGNIVNTGVSPHENYQVLYDQARGLFGLRPLALAVPYAPLPNPRVQRPAAGTAP